MTRTEAEKAVREQVMNLSGEMVNKAPEPGSVWMAERENLRWLYIAQQGRHAIRLTIRKKTGKLMGIDLEGYINSECREIVISPTEEEIQAAYRKQIGETGRSVPQYSDPAGGNNEG